jgi:hypothetical protein
VYQDKTGLLCPIQGNTPTNFKESGTQSHVLSSSVPSTSSSVPCAVQLNMCNSVPCAVQLSPMCRPTQHVQLSPMCSPAQFHVLSSSACATQSQMLSSLVPCAVQLTVPRLPRYAIQKLVLHFQSVNFLFQRRHLKTQDQASPPSQFRDNALRHAYASFNQ